MTHKDHSTAWRKLEQTREARRSMETPPLEISSLFEEPSP